MSPADQLTAKLGPKLFAATLCHCLSDGYVRSEPEFFFMGRAVPSSAKDSDVCDLSKGFHGEQLDAWFVAGMAGDMALALASVPYPLPWFIFQRDNGGVRRYPAESLNRKLSHHGQRRSRSKQTATPQ